MKTTRLVSAAFTLFAFGFALFVGHRTLAAEEVDQPQERNINFQWAFGAMKEAVQGPRFETITRDATLKSGDQIKFFVKKKGRCFVYLLYRSSQGELTVLFPYRFKLLDAEYSTPQAHYIPKGDEWFELDEHVGQETFYLLASAERLHDLEALVNDYESADQSKKPGLADRVLSEIRKLRKQHMKFKSRAERPVRVIGNMRSAEKAKGVGTHDVADYAVEISASRFYSRTFTIDHQ